MKNLNSFKAFELGKAQMNAIVGGAKCSAHILLGGGDFLTIDASNPDMTNDELAQGLHDKYDDLYGGENVIVIVHKMNVDEIFNHLIIRF